MSNQPPADPAPEGPPSPLPEENIPHQEPPQAPKIVRYMGLLGVIVFFFLAITLFRWLFSAGQPAVSDVSELIESIKAEKFVSIHVEPKRYDMMLVTANPKEQENQKADAQRYAIVQADLPEISALARAHGIRYQTIDESELVDSESSFGSYLISFLPIIFLAIYFFLILPGRGGISSIGSSMSKGLGFKLQAARTPQTTFKDVAGMPGPKRDLREVVEFLRNPDKFVKLGASIPRGILLKGPPGTGKTLAARATAGEAGVPFYSFAGSDFVQMFVGMGATRVRDLFRTVKEGGPAIIFIDEIDALGKMRGGANGVAGGNDEREQTLNALLVEMDGFEVSDTLIVIAATNRPDVLDPALLRPGRFDRHVDVARPHERERLEILKVHVRGVPMDADVDLDLIARCTMGFTGADLRNLVNEACLFAARRSRSTVSQLEFEDGFNRAVEGVPGTLELSDPTQRKNTAAHEAGHTAVAYLLREWSLNEVHSTSIKPGVGFLGRMRSLPRTELAHVTKRALLTEMAILYGGRGGELMMNESEDELSAGASNDLMRMTAIAEHMVFEYGFGSKVGSRVLRESKSPSFYDSSSEPLQIGADLQKKADEDVAELVEEAKKRCMDCLRKDPNFHKAITERLDREEEVRGSELAALHAENPSEQSEQDVSV